MEIDPPAMAIREEFQLPTCRYGIRTSVTAISTADFSMELPFRRSIVNFRRSAADFNIRTAVSGTGVCPTSLQNRGRLSR
jgi:hypothetical protein